MVLYAPWYRLTKLLVMLVCISVLVALNDIFHWVRPWALILGVGFQLFNTFVQFLYCNRRRSWKYRLSIAVDAGLNVRSYSMVLLLPLLAVLLPLLGMIPVVGVFLAHLVAWGVIMVFAVAVAVMLEVILVRRT